MGVTFKENVQDIISTFYFLRNHFDVSKLKINDFIRITMFFDADNYNLGLAYESVGERNQALKYYQAASDMSPENEEYINSINRLQ